MDRVDARAGSVRGRLSIAADGTLTETRLTPPGEPGAEKSYVTRVMQRDRLQACLLEEVRERYAGAVDVHFDTKCAGVELSGGRARLILDRPARAADAWDLVVGADGVRSAVRASLEKQDRRIKTVRYEDKNERRYRTIPLHPSRVPGTASDLNWGFQNASAGLGMDALPTKEGEMVAVLLFKPDSPIADRLASLGGAADAREFFSDVAPALLPFTDDEELGRFAERSEGRLPSFQLVEGPVHAGPVVLLGDAIKAVKPYFGQGANSALEDVQILDACLEDAADPEEAAALFTEKRAADARALVKISRGFDGKGKLGTACFVGPLVVDSKLHKMLPSVFSPPLLRAIQNEDNAFADLRKRKRRERGLQVAALAASAAAARALVRAALRLLA